MPYCIQRQDQFLCGSNTTLPHWGRLDAYSALLIFPSVQAADDFMDQCSTVEFDEGDEIVTLLFGIGKG